jgi:hypothetical protein
VSAVQFILRERNCGKWEPDYYINGSEMAAKVVKQVELSTFFDRDYFDVPLQTGVGNVLE